MALSNPKTVKTTGPPLPSGYLPEWMTRLCECGHVDRIHDGACRGKSSGVDRPGRPCACREYRHRPVTKRTQVTRGAWATSYISRAERKAA